MRPTIEWMESKNAIKMIDQVKLPGKLEFLELTTHEQVARSIKEMNIRGAPAIGISAAMGMALASIEFKEHPREEFMASMKNADKLLRNTRPTAVNLFWALDRIQDKLEEMFTNGKSNGEISNALIAEARKMGEEDIHINLELGKQGAKILDDGDTVLTHCNAGSLGTVQHGTALSAIRWAIKQEKKIQVIADETRPRLQGARLTAFELHHDDVPVKVECDNTAGLMMRKGKIQKVIVGADRIVKDAVFNKIGTYMVAICARYHHIPFYVSAPSSTLSLHEEEKDVKIEQRNGWKEVAEIGGIAKNHPIVPKGVECINLAFDATPMELITGIITEHGIFTPKQLIENYGTKARSH